MIKSFLVLYYLLLYCTLELYLISSGQYGFTTTHEFDHSSKKNREYLKEDAGDLKKKIVIVYLVGKLR